jgi:hypothetical protein
LLETTKSNRIFVLDFVQSLVQHRYYHDKVDKSKFQHLIDEPIPDTEEGEADPSNVFFTYIDEATRLEMWNKHQSNPEEWTDVKLSQHYSANLARIQSILYLMKCRNETMAKIGVLNRPALWDDIWAKYAENPATKTSEVLASEFNLTPEEITDILSKMRIHMERVSRQTLFQEQIDLFLEESRAGGYDTSFKEIHDTGPATKYAATYFPKLFGDDDLEYHKQGLLKRVLHSTRAAPSVKVASFFRHAPDTASPSDTPSIVAPDASTELAGTQTFTRYKLAYRDSSLRAIAAHQPTMIRTRAGQ